jgi:hypothetical protein
MVRKLLAALAALSLASAASADVLVDNVNGYTLDDNGRLVRFSAMLVGDDGKARKRRSAPASASTARGGRSSPA